MEKLSYFHQKIKDCFESKTPFFFLIDFSAQIPLIFEWQEAARLGYLFDIRGKNNHSFHNSSLFDSASSLVLNVNPIKKIIYSRAFEEVQKHIRNGNTYLLNLTFASEIFMDQSLESIFYLAKAPYKLYLKNRFVSFSPECFIKIKDNCIYAYPMKGTIKSEIPEAEKTLLNNEKEIWEHHTIVDLLRNDLSKIADQVTVTQFRYLEKIKTHQGEILQTSSEIRGDLPSNWRSQFGEIILNLLPAGSISGAPKKKTIEIINEVEITPRNFYTGIFGIYDGESLDSAVSIRFIEKRESKFWYHSGGGLTFMSRLEEEYQELLDKIYVPII